MAKFVEALPKDLMSDFERIAVNTEKIFGKMTREGAKVAMNNVKATAPRQVIRNGVKLSKTYKTPTDDGINTKVIFKGYVNEGAAFTRRARIGGVQYTTHKGVPVDFIAMLFEYGSSERYTNKGAYRGYYGKKPYFRRAFDKSAITAAMLKVQKKESGGLLE